MNATIPTDYADREIIVYAKDQPPYVPLPASVDKDGTIMTDWEPTAEELAALMRGGKVRLWILYTKVHKGEPMNPLALEVVE